MEDDLKKRKKKKKDNLNKKWKTSQSTKINLIGCDTIVNSPSCNHFPTQMVHEHAKTVRISYPAKHPQIVILSKND